MDSTDMSTPAEALSKWLLETSTKLGWNGEERNQFRKAAALLAQQAAEDRRSQQDRARRAEKRRRDWFPPQDMEDAEEEIAQQAKEIELLQGALRGALEGLEDMRPYVPDYFAEKWQMDGYIERARQALALPPLWIAKRESR